MGLRRRIAAAVFYLLTVSVNTLLMHAPDINFHVPRSFFSTGGRFSIDKSGNSST